MVPRSVGNTGDILGSSGIRSLSYTRLEGVVCSLVRRRLIGKSVLSVCGWGFVGLVQLSRSSYHPLRCRNELRSCTAFAYWFSIGEATVAPYHHDGSGSQARRVRGVAASLAVVSTLLLLHPGLW